MSVYLKCLSDVDAYIKVSFSIIDNESKAVNNKILGYQIFQKSESMGIPEFINHDYLLNKKKDLLPGNELLLQCEIFLDKK